MELFGGTFVLLALIKSLQLFTRTGNEPLVYKNVNKLDTIIQHRFISQVDDDFQIKVNVNARMLGKLSEHKYVQKFSESLIKEKKEVKNNGA